jgi:hypothetical protein
VETFWSSHESVRARRPIAGTKAIDVESSELDPLFIW